MTRNKKIFLYTVIIGLLTHAFRLTNVMVNEDGTNYLNTISPTWSVYLGRFLLPVVEPLRGSYELPFLIGAFSIVMIAFAAVLIADMFDMKRNIALLITAWVLVANPVVTSMFTYMYTADGYMMGLFFSVLAAYFCFKKRNVKGILLGALSLFIALGFYQAFVTVTILLMMLCLMMLLLNPAEKMNSFWKSVGRCALTGGAGMLVYFIVMKIVWACTGQSSTAYMGMDSSEGFQLSNLAQGFVDAYVDFARYFIVRYQVNCYNVMNVLFFLLTAFIVFTVLTKKKLWKQPLRWILLFVMLLLVPAAGFVFEFASSEVAYTSTSMEYGIVLLYLFPVVFMENVDCGAGEFREWLRKDYWKTKTCWILLCILMLCISAHFTVIAHQAYQSVKLANTKVEFLLNRLQARMEVQEGYHDDIELVVVGSTYEKPDYVYAAPMMSGVVSNLFLSSAREYTELLNWYMSTDYDYASEDRVEEIRNMPEFAEMEVWPSENSVRIIDGNMVLYLSED